MESALAPSRRRTSSMRNEYGRSRNDPPAHFPVEVLKPQRPCAAHMQLSRRILNGKPLSPKLMSRSMCLSFRRPADPERQKSVGFWREPKQALSSHNKASVAAFEEAIQRIDAVVECYVMTGGDDCLLRTLVPDLDG